jgi:glutamate-1-semialdehyde 2,1-aminomutase
LLIFDEVITGFRAARGGAAALTGVTPDLVTLGKVIGGGLPVGAFGGRAEIMARLAPLGPVYQAGTLSGNPLATAAGLAALELLDEAAYAPLGRTARRLADGLSEVFDATGAPLVATTAGNLVGIFAGRRAPRDFTEAKTTDEALYARFFHAMLDGGVALAPGAYEVAFPGLAHTDAVIDEVVTVARSAAARAVEQRVVR